MTASARLITSELPFLETLKEQQITQQQEQLLDRDQLLSGECCRRKKCEIKNLHKI